MGGDHRAASKRAPLRKLRVAANKDVIGDAAFCGEPQV